MGKTSPVARSFQNNQFAEKIDFNITSELDETFHRDIFIELLRRSLSLNKHDKLRILLELPRLTAKQIISLNKTLEDEKAGLEKAFEEPFGELEEELQRDRAENEWKEIIHRWCILNEHQPKATFDVHNLLTPQALHLLLDYHVIGQSHVTKELSTLVYHQMLASHIAIESSSILPKVTRPILLAGFTGTGKTFTIQKICELAELPFVHINTASMVEEGIVGTSINDIGKEILRKANNDVNRAKFAIVFLDEFDKTMGGSVYGGTVANQLLRIIEGSDLMLYPGRWDDSETRPKESSLSTGSMLFILGGAFQNLLESKNKVGLGFGAQPSIDGASLSWKDLVRLGFPKELAGRINTILTLNPLTEDDYYIILTEGGSSPLKDYLQLIRGYGDEIHIPDEALREIARQAAETGLGTRALHKIVYSVFKDILYEAPNPILQTFEITREKVLDVVEGECM